MQSLTWYDAVRWCNARSEKDGLVPVYYTDAAQTMVYRSGNVDLSNAMVKWTANGYRLPTEAEWEKAARGGLSGKAYPWGDTITGSLANYNDSAHPWKNVAPCTTPGGYYNGGQQGGGGDMANGYGLYDMSGNVWEWCWDLWSSPPSGDQDPKGPDSGNTRLLRGGAWNSGASELRCAYRHNYDAGSSVINWGFRCARGL